ncbi:S-layer homology domain-containing protein [Paenibacillus sp. RRE4]|uniref:S-layer homology domain-containing protein n=1 Tax=Paenibacillus sp. RRE4 TaxID=2962587 RepID=UPI002882D313|nr:S-layer homology domain-containing protein [Paenibacillus sp. RRE4]MDT0125485.1 S-layer homology domain-containing protein [Paenibacillus sp. RRE4]
MILLLSSFSSAAGSVFAGPISNNIFTVVNTNGDDSTGSLAWAIAQAGQVPDGKVIFDASLAGSTITLMGSLTHWNPGDSASVEIGAQSTGSFTIEGLTDAQGKPAITIDGNGVQGIYASGSGTFSMSNLIMKNFNTVDTHGGLDYMGSALTLNGNNYSSVTLDNIYFIGNNKAFRSGGGIVSLSVVQAPYKVNINRVKFLSNSLAANDPTNNTYQGMLFFQSFVQATITNSLFAENVVNTHTSSTGIGSISSGGGAYDAIWYNNTFANNNLTNDQGGVLAPIAYLTDSGRPANIPFENEFRNNIVANSSLNSNAETNLSALLVRASLDVPAVNVNPNLIVNSADSSLFKNTDTQDYRLNNQAVSAIDQGNSTYVLTNFDLDGNSRINGGNVDLGALEYMPGSNATLESVANQTPASSDVSGGNGSSISNAIKWNLNMPLTVNEIDLNSLKLQDTTATVNLYKSSDYASNEVTGNNTIPIKTDGQATYLYVKVTAENGTTVKYYEIAVYPPITEVTLLSAVANGSDTSTTTKIDLTFDKDVIGFNTESMLIFSISGSASVQAVSGSGKNWSVSLDSIQLDDPDSTSGQIYFILNSLPYVYNLSVDSSLQTHTIYKAKAPHTTPQAAIDYVNEKLTGLEPGSTYSINGSTVIADTHGNVDIPSYWMNQTVNVIRVASGGSVDSQPQSFIIPARPLPPMNISVTNATYAEAHDGMLFGVNSAMEYTISDVIQWNSIHGNEIDHLAVNTYFVRYKATATSFASKATGKVVGVQDPNAEIVPAPVVTADDTLNTIIGLDTTMEISVDGQAYVLYNGSNLPSLTGEHEVKVRYAATSSKPAGLITLLLFTADPLQTLVVTASDASGSGNNGKTLLTINSPGLPGTGNQWLFKNFGTANVMLPEIGSKVSDYSELPSNGLVSSSNGDSIVVVEADLNGNVLRFALVKAIVVDDNSGGSGSNGGSSSGGGGSSPSPTPTVPTPGSTTPGATKTDVIVLVNGKQENAGEAITTTENNIKTTKINVDTDKLKAKLDAEGPNAIVTIPVPSGSDVNQAQITGQALKNMQDKSATIVLQTDTASYKLPSKEIQLGQAGATLDNMQILLQIIKSVESTTAKMTQASKSKDATLLTVPYDFKVTVTTDGKSVDVTSFNSYVERTIQLPDDVDPSKITTGVVLRDDNTIDHIPTRVIKQDNKYYAVLNSLTNSNYSVVWHPMTFADVNTHWAKEAVNDMGSRMIVNGVTDSTFNPNNNITRAEFAAIIVRALGLPAGAGNTSFSDVRSDAWYSGAVETAVSYKLINGFEDGTFRPQNTITREQAMSIVAKAMSLTGLAERNPVSDTTSALAHFADYSQISGWAKDNLALTVRAKLINGRNANIDAKANMTRAEVAVLVERLLKQSDLI